jgi:SAM-dependent methyltransferase
MSLLKFPHPKVINENFIFKNGEFHNLNNENEKLKILEYSENTQGWNDELTKMADHDISNNHPIDDASTQMCLDLLQKYEKSEKKIVLEIGCLNGNLAKKIINTEKYYYIGSDAINNSIQNLSKIYKDTPFIIFDILKNPFKKSICNTLIMLNVLEHVEDDDKALAEAYNMLEKDGLLIIEVPAGKFLYDDYDRQLLHFRRYSLKEITNKLLKNGFTIEKKTHLGFFIFPFFVVVKMINKILKNKNIVIKQTKITDNFLIKFLFYIEKKLENFSLPFGIRCVICAKKK